MTQTREMVPTAGHRHGIASMPAGSASVRLPATLACPVQLRTSGPHEGRRGSLAPFACTTEIFG